MKTITGLSILFLILISSFSCSGDKESEVNLDKYPIVSFKGNTLYKSELDAIIPAGLPAEDSISSVKAYIDTWLNNQLMYDKARQNITRRAEIDRLIEDYRKSLVTNIYQEQLLKQHLSQFISENELKAYYEQNKDRFKLEENIIKGLFLKIPVESSQLSNFQKWYKQGTNDAIENIEKNTLQNAVGYEFFYDRWIDFDDVMDNIPSTITDRRQFLQANKNLEVRDSSFVYLLNIKDFRLSDTEAPYEYIKGQLSEIFAEQKKADFLKQVQKDLYDKAISDKEIKFYDK